MTPKNRKKHHVNTFELEDGTLMFIGNKQQAKDFYEELAPGEKVYIVYDEDSQECYVEADL